MVFSNAPEFYSSAHNSAIHFSDVSNEEALNDP